MAVIKTESLYKTYAETQVEVHALNGVDMNVEEGEFSAVVGPSGSGKTTLLNIIGGLDDATSGRVEIDGKDITGMKENERIDFRLYHIGFVFQSFNLIPVLTAQENVEFIMLMQGWDKKKRQERAMELLRAVGLEERVKNRPGELSGGQQQRVAVARALASRPSFVLADEPTANLDSHSSADLLDMMGELNRNEDVTFIFSTHDQRVIDRARRVLTLEDGKIVSDEVKEKEGAKG